MEEIESLIIAGKLTDAALRLEARLQLTPEDAGLLYLSGLVTARQGHLASAREQLQACLAQRPEHAYALVALGQVEQRSGDVHAAQQLFDRAIGLDPNLAGAHASLGDMALLEGESATAENRYRTALRADQNDPQALIGLAALALQKASASEALAHLKPLLDKPDADPRVLQVAAAAFLSQGHTDFALQSIERAQAGHSPMSASLRFLQVQALRKANRPAEVEKSIRSFASEHPNSAQAWAMLAEAELARGQFERAINAADRALSLGPNASHTVRLKAAAYLRLGEVTIAEQVLSEQVQAHPSDHAGWRMLLASMTGRKAHAKALEWARRWAEAAPSEPDAHGDMAALLEFQGELEAAMLAARAALRLSSGHINAMLIAARAELRIGRPGPALARLDRVLPASLEMPQQMARLALLARAADSTGDAELAISRWAERHTKDPALLPIWEQESADQAKVVPHQAVLKVDQPLQLVFMLGLPGSGVQHVAAAMARIPEIGVLSDRFTNQARSDGLSRPDWASFERGLSEGQAAVLRRRWIKPLERWKVAMTGQVLVDWLPHLDVRMYAAIARAFPEAKLLLIDREPRDSLLDWLAFSSPQRLRFPGPAKAGQWFAAAHSHLDFALSDGRLPALRIAYEQITDAATQAQLGEFLGVAKLDLKIDAPTTLGGLQAQFASGHWQKYVDELGPAFNALGRSGKAAA